MPSALDWLTTAKECFTDEYGSLQQGLLTSIFSLVVGLERVFHLEEMEDAGFARLCGSRRCPSRYTVGAWRRHLSWYEVDAFCRRTCPKQLCKLVRGELDWIVMKALEKDRNRRYESASAFAADVPP